MKLRVLDCFAGEGGAGMGYFLGFYRLGWDVEVIGLENNRARARRNPFQTYRTDALDYVTRYGHEYGLIHGSPPCQAYSRGTVAVPDRLTRYDRLIAAFRDVVQETGVPYVIENVADARPELRDPILLCGRYFGLETMDEDGTPLVLDRHRLFETSIPIQAPEHPVHAAVQVAGSYSGTTRNKHDARHIRKGGYVPSPAVQRRLLGAYWMSTRGCQLSIPPAYTSWLAGQMAPVIAGSYR